MTLDDDNKRIKITCQRCNGFLIYLGSIIELIYHKFLYNGMSTLGLYPEDIELENF